MHILRLVALFVLVALGVVIWAQGARFYVSPRFGATALVPEDWSAAMKPENGDGGAFVSPDGDATETISGANRNSASLSDDFNRLSAAQDGERLSYVRRGKKWIVISGVKNDRIFYRKSQLSCGDTIWNTVAVEYPAARKDEFDPLVTRIAGSLHGLGKACP